MKISPKLCAVLPVKDSGQAKQRLAGVLSGAQRRELALTMLEDVLTTLASVSELAGILVVTADPSAGAIAARYGARVTGDGAWDGHTGAVAAAARQLAAEGLGMLEVPGDIPLVEAGDISQLIDAHDSVSAGTPAFTIVPARDQRGSNAVLCSPADAVPLRFGENSFFPHLAAARACGIEPNVVQLPRIALDIDTPDELALFLATPSRTRARALLEQWHVDRGDGIKATA
jgi:2-phospho-L-lactate/phosphoenolpyruvate guanylyltransferase